MMLWFLIGISLGMCIGLIVSLFIDIVKGD